MRERIRWQPDKDAKLGMQKAAMPAERVPSTMGSKNTDDVYERLDAAADDALAVHRALLKARASARLGGTGQSDEAYECFVALEEATRRARRIAGEAGMASETLLDAYGIAVTWEREPNL